MTTIREEWDNCVNASRLLWDLLSEDERARWLKLASDAIFDGGAEHSEALPFVQGFSLGTGAHLVLPEHGIHLLTTAMIAVAKGWP